MVQEIRWEQPWPLQHPEHRQAPIVPYSWHMTFGNRHSPLIAFPPHCISHPCAVSRKEHKTPHHPFLRRRSHNQPNMLNPYSLVILRAYISRTINGTHLHCQPRSVKNVETKTHPKDDPNASQHNQRKARRQNNHPQDNMQVCNIVPPSTQVFTRGNESASKVLP